MAKTTWLQGLGNCAGKPASEFRVGEFMMWNYGYCSEVIEIVAHRGSMIDFKVLTKDGKIWNRRLKGSRIVATASEMVR